MSRDENWVLSSEDSSSPDDPELELGLALSLGGAPVSKTQQGSKDFPSVVSSSSSSLSRVSFADSVPNGCSQVVGWPPVRAHRMNSLSNQAKLQAADKPKKAVEKTIDEGDGDKEHSRRSSFVKVNMDGSAIGRKVDLKAHRCYQTLAETLEDMFLRPTTISNTTKEMTRRIGHSKLLDGSCGFVLTYEDKDGDWMLAGDVPWRMFYDSVKRLRIMRTSEANGLAPRIQDHNASPSN